MFVLTVFVLNSLFSFCDCKKEKLYLLQYPKRQALCKFISEMIKNNMVYLAKCVDNGSCWIQNICSLTKKCICFRISNLHFIQIRRHDMIDRRHI